MNRTVSKVSLAAHNRGKEFPVHNDNYNIFYKLGTPEDRLFLEGMANDEHGYKHNHLSPTFLKKSGVEIK